MDKKNEPWYSAKAVFRHDVANSYEERIVIIRADSFDDAHEKALVEAQEYISMLNEVSLVKIVDVFHMFDETLKDGVEVYSHMDKTDMEPAEYIAKKYA